MKDFTRQLKEERYIDIKHIRQQRNNTLSKRTQQRLQQTQDNNYTYYFVKWLKYFKQCETRTQKRICECVINYLISITEKEN